MKKKRKGTKKAVYCNARHNINSIDKLHGTWQTANTQICIIGCTLVHTDIHAFIVETQTKGQCTIQQNDFDFQAQ